MPASELKDEGPLTSSKTRKKSVYMRGLRRTSSNDFKKPGHPFLCRLRDSAAFTVSAPSALISAGFASLWMGLFTMFRPTPLLLFSLASRAKKIMAVGQTILIVLLWSWQGTVMFVLLFLGFLLTLSTKIKKRWVLMLHPWGLLLLYCDVVVWLCLGLVVHLGSASYSPGSSGGFSESVPTPLVFFIFIYLESFCFAVIHYIYATYFITAELTVIEKFY